VKPLAILITNIWLANRAGSEVVVRDLALGLLRRGHRPIVYSPELGEMAEEIASHGVAVIDDLRNWTETPDIIHGHHAIPVGEALIRFPATPAIFVCHSSVHWLEEPVHFPQIGAYVAVDEACRDRFVQSANIDSSRVVILPNAVDLRRVPFRPNVLPSRPSKVLAFGKAAAVSKIETACQERGLEFSAFGYAVNRSVPKPEYQLVKADIVFATARAALEALCCGCAVVVCDRRGMAGMVTSQNFDSLRKQNFGLRSLKKPVTTETLHQAFDAYDSVDATEVGNRARREADLEKALDRYEGLYFEVLEGPRRPQITALAYEQARTDFLHNYLPRLVELQRTLLKERAERLAAETRLNSVLTSRSWRLAAPLRHLKLMLFPR
jgi:Glycosyltransferase Family 4